MKSNSIILSLLLIVEGLFASEVNKALCPCGPIEHLLGKSIVRKYVKDHSNSGLIANDDNEGVPANIVSAIEQFGQTINLVDADGNVIMPREFQNTGKMVLPMYLCPEFKDKSKVLSYFNVENRTNSAILFKQFMNLYQLNKLCPDGICGECHKQNRKLV
ncbi:MAG: hypothetical protein Q8Q60_04055 [Candidatus Chromulinivorax sp.]|nr:hypothetical protein [Candidatus Chromulinivorax sp.]